MKRESLFPVLISLFLLASPSSASQFESTQDFVVDCISKIGTQTKWETCREMMFEPCEAHKIGSQPHVACLEVEKKAWDEHLDAYINLLNNKLTLSGGALLSESLGQWYQFRQSRCSAVAEERAAIGFNPEAAGYGCMIAETAGIVSDLDACLSGRSTAPYCTIKEQ